MVCRLWHPDTGGGKCTMPIKKPRYSKDELINMIEKGYSTIAIAIKYEISESTVNFDAKKYGISRIKPIGKRIITMYNNGKSKKDIAKELKIHRNNVLYYVKRYCEYIGG